MKKILVYMLFAMTFVSISAGITVAATDSALVQKAISEYKKGNYIGCISDLRIYNQLNEKNAVAWYYLGSAYMKIAMKDESMEAFDNVIKLNSVPKLTSYAIQAKMCIESGALECHYYNLTPEEINKLRDNPGDFLGRYTTDLKKNSEKSRDVIEIEKLISGAYSENIHTEAHDFIQNLQTSTRQSEINTK